MAARVMKKAMKTVKKTQTKKSTNSKSKDVALSGMDAVCAYYNKTDARGRPLSGKKTARGKQAFKNQKCGPMIRLHQNVFWGPSKLLNGAGFGVFAARDFKKGEIIDIAPCLIDKNSNWTDEDKERVTDDYTMDFDKHRGALMLGNGSLFNHSDNYNVVSEFGRDHTILFMARRRVIKDEELFINYGKGWWSDRKATMGKK